MPKIASTLFLKDVRALAHGPDGTYPIARRLYLQVRGGRASVLFRYTSPATHKTRAKGLGVFDPDSPLASDALKELHLEAMKLAALVQRGGDPLWEDEQTDALERQRREQAEAERKKEKLDAITFRQVANDYISIHGDNWSKVHRGQWRSTLETYAYPSLGARPIGEITQEDVLAIVRPLWKLKPVTAGRVRNRIERVFSLAKHRKLVTSNPAAWRDALEHELGDSGHTATSHRAVPAEDMPDVMAALAARDVDRARALRLVVWTAARSKTIYEAQWGEFDLDRGLWSVPHAKMKSRTMRKAKLDWVCPLPADAVAMLRTIKPADAQPDDYVFPGHRSRTGRLAADSMDKELKAVGRAENVHGMRSTWRSWAAERGFNHEACEFQLAHVTGDNTVRRYQRSQLVPERARIMTEWAKHCAGESTDNVVPLVRVA